MFVYKYRNTLAFDVLPKGDNGSLNLDALKRTMDLDTNWFNGLSRKEQLKVFVSAFERQMKIINYYNIYLIND